MNFQDNVIKTFEIRFDSIRKDCDRYSDALIELIETEKIERKDYFTLSGAGSLWITFQYIDAGHIDAVESDLKRGEANRDTFGPLHENTQLTLDRLVETGAHETVANVYRAAIKHRMRALKSELAFQRKVIKHGQVAASKWIKTYLPVLRKMIAEYEGYRKLNPTSSNLLAPRIH